MPSAMYWSFDCMTTAEPLSAGFITMVLFRFRWWRAFLSSFVRLSLWWEVLYFATDSEMCVLTSSMKKFRRGLSILGVQVLLGFRVLVICWDTDKDDAVGWDGSASFCVFSDVLFSSLFREKCAFRSIRLSNSLRSFLV